MELSSIVVARNLGLGKKDREQIHPSIERFLKKIIDLNGLDLSNTINVALESYLKEKGYLSSDVLDFLENISDLEKAIFLQGIETTAIKIKEQQLKDILSKLEKNIES
jgi:hypothetical protein